jgi:predicted RNase H-like nuclease (RuvC/YqgF family)
LEEVQRQLLAGKSEASQTGEKLQGEVARLNAELQHAAKKAKEAHEAATERQRTLEKDLENAKKTVHDLTKSQASAGDKDTQVESLVVFLF